MRLSEIAEKENDVDDWEGDELPESAFDQLFRRTKIEGKLTDKEVGELYGDKYQIERENSSQYNSWNHGINRLVFRSRLVVSGECSFLKRKKITDEEDGSKGGKNNSAHISEGEEFVEPIEYSFCKFCELRINRRQEWDKNGESEDGEKEEPDTDFVKNFFVLFFDLIESAKDKAKGFRYFQNEGNPLEYRQENEFYVDDAFWREGIVEWDAYYKWKQKKADDFQVGIFPEWKTRGDEDDGNDP